MYNTRFKLVLLIGGLSLLLASCGVRDKWMSETGSAAAVPRLPEPSFSQYVADSRANIQNVLQELRFQSEQSPYIGDYNSEQAAQMRGPFQLPEQDSAICWDAAQGGGKGFLLIHGLNDSPYLLRSVANSLKKAYPCALIRAVLLPGHGTVAGDSLQMKHQDWMKITDYGVRSFQQLEQINDLYLVGFSTGTALAIRHLQDGQSPAKIKGLILLSAAVKANTRFAFAAGFISKFKDWGQSYAERDAARYESFSLNAGAEFYQLTKELFNPGYRVEIPVLMAVSADDTTIDADAARDFFCTMTPVGKRTLIWYESRDQSRNQQEETESTCSDIVRVELGNIERNYQGTSYRFANFSHISLAVSPDDLHYGVNGKYRNCKSYEGKGKPDDFENCQQGTQKSIFGEKNIASSAAMKELDYDFWRRGTFNPDYARLEESILCFSDDNCAMQNLLDLHSGLNLSQNRD